MKEILIIPLEQGDSYTVGSVSEAMIKLGVSYHILHKAIESGTAIEVNGKMVFVDIELDVDESEPVEQPVKYELIAVNDGNKVYSFTSYVELAKFCKRSFRTIRKAIVQDKAYITSRDGEKYAMRVLNNDKIRKREI